MDNVSSNEIALLGEMLSKNEKIKNLYLSKLEINNSDMENLVSGLHKNNKK
jgi:hypothetical protein